MFNQLKVCIDKWLDMVWDDIKVRKDEIPYGSLAKVECYLVAVS